MTSLVNKVFIRIWLGKNDRPNIADVWWEGFRDLHKDWKFITLTDNHNIFIPNNIKPIYNSVATYAGRSDILRLLALDQIGGVYVDNVIPSKPKL